MMDIVKHYKLGVIVGQPTSGASGRTNKSDLAGKYRVTWSGEPVRKLDGSQHHLVGIQPDVPARRTIEGVRSGEDEVLQKALEALQEEKTSDTEQRTQ